MKKKYKLFIVDDNSHFIDLVSKLLKTEDNIITSDTSSKNALAAIIEQKPDCVLLDIMMPDIDGLELCKRLRREPGLNEMKIIIVSAKTYEFDRKRAFEFGADGYIIKPIDPKKFPEQVKRIIQDRIHLTFWGVHGTLPVPGPQNAKYGGNTSCVNLEFANGDLMIFDAGSGIKALSDHLVAERILPIEAKIFISHPHWDHINAIPFFSPLYMRGNEFDIYGPSYGDETIRKLISAQMDGVFFPIKIKDFSATVNFRNLKEETFNIDNIKIRTMLLNHPGYCLGYRVQYKGRSVSYVTDNEIYPKSSQFHNEDYMNKLMRFVKNTDALITDCTYYDEEYESKINWGHSSIGQVVDLSDRAGVKTLYLFHHDPDQTDADIDKKLEVAQVMLKQRKSGTRCIAPKEKQLFEI